MTDLASTLDVYLNTASNSDLVMVMLLLVGVTVVVTFTIVWPIASSYGDRRGARRMVSRHNLCANAHAKRGARQRL